MMLNEQKWKMGGALPISNRKLNVRISQDCSIDETPFLLKEKTQLVIPSYLMSVSPKIFFF